jgi:N-acyl-D-amino-acid deacylase
MDKQLKALIDGENKNSAMLDIIIRNGWIVDGTGNPKYRGDIGIKGDRIVQIGKLGEAQAVLNIDATGKIICPGFIDAHSHTDVTIMANPTAESTIRQGVTTEVVGNCGNSFAPITKAARSQGSGGFGSFLKDDRVDYTFSEFLETVKNMGTSNNIAWLVGHNSVRFVAGVRGQNPTEKQMKDMENLIREAMEAGAVGFSTGLEFEPGRSCLPEEVMRLAKVVKEYDAIYTSHIRNRADKVLESLDEFMNVVRAYDIRGEISHMNIRYNTGAPEGAWQKCMDKIENVRAQGFDVLTDMTPLNFGIGQMAGILPPWLRSEGSEKAIEMLKSPQVRSRLRNDCDRYWRFIHRGEWDRVIMQSNPAFPEINGLNFVQISHKWNKDPWDCYFDILAEAGEGMDGVVLVARLFTDEHLRETISNPLYMLVMDGYSTCIDGKLAKETAFPLHFMGMTYFLTHHVRQIHTLSLEEAIRKMTSMPATHFRLCDRGLLHKGCYADVVVFDFDELDTVSTIEKPLAYVKGIEYVLVNGIPVVYKSEHTGVRSGRNLLR